MFILEKMKKNSFSTLINKLGPKEINEDLHRETDKENSILIKSFNENKNEKSKATRKKNKKQKILSHLKNEKDLNFKSISDFEIIQKESNENFENNKWKILDEDGTNNVDEGRKKNGLVNKNKLNYFSAQVNQIENPFKFNKKNNLEINDYNESHDVIEKSQIINDYEIFINNEKVEQSYVYEKENSKINKIEKNNNMNYINNSNEMFEKVKKNNKILITKIENSTSPIKNLEISEISSPIKNKDNSKYSSKILMRDLNFEENGNSNNFKRHYKIKHRTAKEKIPEAQMMFLKMLEKYENSQISKNLQNSEKHKKTEKFKNKNSEKIEILLNSENFKTRVPKIKKSYNQNNFKNEELLKPQISINELTEFEFNKNTMKYRKSDDGITRNTKKNSADKKYLNISNFLNYEVNKQHGTNNEISNKSVHKKSKKGSKFKIKKKKSNNIETEENITKDENTSNIEVEKTFEEEKEILIKNSPQKENFEKSEKSEKIRKLSKKQKLSTKKFETLDETNQQKNLKVQNYLEREFKLPSIISNIPSDKSCDYKFPLITQETEIKTAEAILKTSQASITNNNMNVNDKTASFMILSENMKLNSQNQIVNKDSENFKNLNNFININNLNKFNHNNNLNESKNSGIALDKVANISIHQLIESDKENSKKTSGRLKLKINSNHYKNYSNVIKDELTSIISSQKKNLKKEDSDSSEIKFKKLPQNEFHYNNNNSNLSFKNLNKSNLNVPLLDLSIAKNLKNQEMIKEKLISNNKMENLSSKIENENKIPKVKKKKNFFTLCFC